MGSQKSHLCVIREVCGQRQGYNGKAYYTTAGTCGCPSYIVATMDIAPNKYRERRRSLPLSNRVTGGNYCTVSSRLRQTEILLSCKRDIRLDRPLSCRAVQATAKIPLPNIRCIHMGIWNRAFEVPALGVSTWRPNCRRQISTLVPARVRHPT